MAQHGLSTQPNRDGAPAVHVGPPNDGIQEMFESLARRAFEIFESNGHGLGHDLENWAQAERELFHPAHLEISETDGKFAVRAEVPGFSAKELEISMDGRRLTISGKREKREERKDKKRIYSEYCSDQVLRAVDLPADVNAERGSAYLKNGILELEIPKAAPASKVPIA